MSHITFRPAAKDEMDQIAASMRQLVSVFLKACSGTCRNFQSWRSPVRSIAATV